MSVNGLPSLWNNKYQQYFELLNVKTFNSKPVPTILGSVFQSIFPLLLSYQVNLEFVKTGQPLTVHAARPILTRSRRPFTYWRVSYLSEIQPCIFVLFPNKMSITSWWWWLWEASSLSNWKYKKAAALALFSPKTVSWKIKQKNPYQPQDSLDICHLLFNHVVHKLIVTYTEIISAVSWLLIYNHWHQKWESYGPHSTWLLTALSPNVPLRELISPSIPSIPASYWSPVVMRKSCSIVWGGNAKPLNTAQIIDSLLLCPSTLDSTTSMYSKHKCPRISTVIYLSTLQSVTVSWAAGKHHTSVPTKSFSFSLCAIPTLPPWLCS